MTLFLNTLTECDRKSVLSTAGRAHPSKTWLLTDTLFLTVHGSRALGLYTDQSDWDLKGVALAPVEHYLGFGCTFEQHEFKLEELDVEGVTYELRKFLKLASDCNPNIVEVLFTDEKDHLHLNKAFEDTVLYNRDVFLTKKAFHTFSGYAQSQLKRIKSHRHWLLNPPAGMPTPEDFGIKELMNKSQYGAAEQLFSDNGNDVGEDFVTRLQQERAYRNAVTNFKQYQQWKNNRNPKRHAMEAKCGYDSKHATHLLRLLTMAGEILGQGKCVVNREVAGDREKLMEVRNGHWTYEQLVEEAERLDEVVKTAYKTSTLPDKCPMDVVSDMARTLLEEHVLAKQS